MPIRLRDNSVFSLSPRAAGREPERGVFGNKPDRHGILLSMKSGLSVVSSASSTLPSSARETRRCKNRIALAPAFAQYPPKLARVLSAAVNSIEAFPVEVELNSGWADTVVVNFELPKQTAPLLERLL